MTDGSSWSIPAESIPAGWSLERLRAKALTSTPMQWRVLCDRWRAANEGFKGPDAEETVDLPAALESEAA